MFTTGFARDLAERPIATFAEALAALLIADGLGVLETDWVAMLSAAGATALIALLKGVAAYKLGDNATGASLLSDPPPRVERNEGGWMVFPVIAGKRGSLRGRIGDPFEDDRDE